ncbi:MAG: hypothetical protein ACFFCQ_15145, partial [Promethearchaeota archaeon]
VKKVLMKLLLTKGLELLIIVLDAIGVDILDLLADIFSKTYNMIKDFKDLIGPSFISTCGTIMREGLNQIANSLESLATDSTTFDDLPAATLSMPTLPSIGTSTSSSSSLIDLIPYDQIYGDVQDELGSSSNIIESLFGANNSIYDVLEQLIGKLLIPADRFLGFLLKIISLLLAGDFSGFADEFEKISSASIHWTAGMLRTLGNYLGQFFENFLRKFMLNVVFDLPLRIIGGVVDLFLIPVYIYEEVSGWFSFLRKIRSLTGNFTTQDIHELVSPELAGRIFRTTRLFCRLFQNRVRSDSIYAQIVKLIYMIIENILTWGFFVSDNYDEMKGPIKDMPYDTFMEQAFTAMFHYPWKGHGVSEEWLQEGLPFELQELFYLDWLSTVGQFLVLLVYGFKSWSLNVPVGYNRTYYYHNINYFLITDQQGNTLCKRYNAEAPMLLFSTLGAFGYLGATVADFINWIKHWDYKWNVEDFFRVAGDVFDFAVSLVKLVLEFITPLIEGFDEIDLQGDQQVTWKHRLRIYITSFHTDPIFYDNGQRRVIEGKSWWEVPGTPWKPDLVDDGTRPTCGIEKWNNRLQWIDIILLILAVIANSKPDIADIIEGIIDIF